MMATLAGLAARWVELTAAAAALVVITKAVKYRDFTSGTSLRWGDVGWLALGELAVVLLSLVGPAGHVVGTLGGTLLVGALWLDAVLFRVFTIELGPGGVGSVILSVLYRELAELTFARRFFAAHRLFAAVPLGALVLHLGVPLVPAGVGSVGLALGLALGLGGGLVLTAAACTPPRARRQVLAASALLVLAALAGALAPPLALGLAAAGVGGWLVLGLSPARRAGGPDALRHFFLERPWPDPPDFQPRPEHAALLTQAPRPPRPSPLHGLLRGEDVLLFTFESVGQPHLGVVSPGGARAPFLEGLWPNALRSRHHACVSPTTNNAHRALYTSGYGAGPSAGLDALRRAGYRTVYLTTARTADYGLREILDAAGFEHVLGREALETPLETPGEGVLTDRALLTRGLERLAEVLGGHRPFLVHVHTANTHVPYRVDAPERFQRFDAREDRGRFFNGIEEGDALLGALYEALRARGLTREPLVVVSSDHGQSFGALGYQSHGSAVVREQLDVPLVLHHPRLPAREVAFSSHFDVLPTVVDLVGLGFAEPVWGESLGHDDRRPELLVWAGHPSRGTTSHYGLLGEKDKWMVDLALGRCLRADWAETRVDAVEGAEKAYVEALVSRLMRLRGVT